MKRSIAWPRARSRPWNPWRARGMTMPASERARVTFRSNALMSSAGRRSRYSSRLPMMAATGTRTPRSTAQRAWAVVGEYVFGLARPIQAEVTPGAPEAPGARDERLRVSTRDPLRERDPPSKFAAPDSLHLSRDVGDRPEEDQPNHAPIAGAGRVVEHLVGAGGVPGKDDTAVAALDGKGDHRSDVLDALAEPLEGRAGEVLAPAGDDIVAAV